MDDNSDHAAAAAEEPEPPALPPPLPNDPSPADDDPNAPTAADEGYTPVYAENRSFAAAATAGGVKRKSGAPPAQRFYAVRSGLNVSNCVFFRWQDAEPQVSVALADDSNLHIEFEEFDDIDDAWEYIATGDAPEVARPRKRSKKSSGYGDSTPGGGEQSGKKNLWEAQYQELVNFKARNGHCLVPSGKKQETKLSRWVSRQRLEYRYFKEGKATAMTQERIDRLEEIGFAFKAWDAKRVATMTGAPGGIADGFRTSAASSNAAAAAVAAAAASGGTFVHSALSSKDQKFAKSFNEQYERLLMYKAEIGHCDVPGNHPALGRWVQQIRSLCKKRQEGKDSAPLTEEQFNRLMSAEFVMKARRGPKGGRRKENDDDSNPMAWDNMYNELKEFKAKNGHANVPQNPYTPLRGWILRQRNEYKRLRSNEPSLLTARRLQMLNDLGLEWNNKKTLKWDERFEQLKGFKQKHAHCIVPRNYEEDDAAGLGKWVAQQRHAYKLMKEGKSSTMTAERAKQFNDIGMVWSILKQPETRAERLPWEERFKQLLAYKEQKGHTVVPQHYPGGLGNWVHQQRTHYVYFKTGRKSLMTQQKVNKLTDAGFVFSVKKGKTWDPESSSSGVDIAKSRAETAGVLLKTDDGAYEPAIKPSPIEVSMPALPPLVAAAASAHEENAADEFVDAQEEGGDGDEFEDAQQDDVQIV
mmetsp:Transcript_8789/g.18877  ORF Transcript_8789/g.18877 Transcript_8789/m.18877 type:complete len:697 (-) Transcript_8789:102-2192(-)